tara:strand:+ start:156 stop:698 length:543 start_codon:yes stop_codon:yes gene_type:complete
MIYEINKSLEFLKNGKIILYPTDTIWGMGCDATNTKSVRKIYRIKKRDDSKSLVILVSDEKMLHEITSEVHPLSLSKFPTTVIYPKVHGLPEHIKSMDGSVAIRIVQDDFCKKIIYALGKPIVSTSANISGKKHPLEFNEISREILKKCDYIVNLRKDEQNINPSRIFKLEKNGEIIKIR